MSIWFQPPSMNDLATLSRGTMIEYLGIEITAIGDDYLAGRMPVDHRTLQPYGLLHGGASVALAESLGSYAAGLTVDPARYLVVGQEINANHLRSMRSGWVQGVARPVHIGGRSQVWGIELRDERGRLTCISRLTMAVVGRTPAGSGTGDKP